MNLLHEKKLLKRIKKNDRLAAEKLIDLHYKAVYYFILKFSKNKELAEDLTQETFLRAWKSINNFNGRSRFSTWLYRIAYNICIDSGKKNKLSTVAIERSSAKIKQDENPLPDMMILKNENKKMMLNYVDQLVPHHRDIIIMHYQEGLSFKEISFVLDIPKGTAKSRVHLALEELRKMINEDY